MNIDGKVAVVTGAASGIGRATAETLAQAGARVLLADIAEDRGNIAAGELQARGHAAEFFPMDVTDGPSVAAFREHALAWGPQIDIVVNVAGWGRIEPFVDNAPDFQRRIVDLNLMGPITVTQAFLGGMIERQSGKIVNISSDAGRVGSLGETVYSAAKGGVIAFTKSLAREMARYAINVNCICPGPTQTPLLAGEPEKFLEAFKRATPMRRFAEPEEIADAILFFAGDRSRFVTGQVLSVSGGLTMVD